MRRVRQQFRRGLAGSGIAVVPQSSATYRVVWAPVNSRGPFSLRDGDIPRWARARAATPRRAVRSRGLPGPPAQGAGASAHRPERPGGAAHGSGEVVVLPTPGAAGPRPHAGHLAIDLADAGPGGGAPAAGNPRCVPEQPALADRAAGDPRRRDRKSTRLNSSHEWSSYA